MSNLQDNLNEEEILKGVIKKTVDDICSLGVEKYPNICRYASRSNEDKSKIVDDIFDMMTADTLPSTLLGALTQVDNKLNNWPGEE